MNTIIETGRQDDLLWKLYDEIDTHLLRTNQRRFYVLKNCGKANFGPNLTVGGRSQTISCHFVLWLAVSQTKYCYSLKIKLFGPSRGGFIIRLKRLKPRAPNFEGAQNFGSRTISSISASNYTCAFVLVQRTFFYYALTKDLKSRVGKFVQ